MSAVRLLGGLLLEKPALATYSYNLELDMLHLFCNTVHVCPQVGRAIVISLRVLCTEIQRRPLPCNICDCCRYVVHCMRKPAWWQFALKCNSMENTFRCA